MGHEAWSQYVRRESAYNPPHNFLGHTIEYKPKNIELEYFKPNMYSHVMQE